MNTIVVCGDSWMAPKVHVPGTHFSEIFAKNYNSTLVPYARSAMGNGGIILQVESAIKQRPDLILLGTTSSDRIEFKIKDEFNNDKEITLDDLSYGRQHGDVSSVNRELMDNNASLRSEALRQFIDSSFSKIESLNEDENRIKKEAILNYFKELYHHNWKVKVDRYMWYAMFHKLNVSNIPYIVCYDHILSNDELSLLTEGNCFFRKFSTFRKPFAKNEVDPGYHTTIETQQEIAKALINHYEKYFLSQVTQ